MNTGLETQFSAASEHFQFARQSIVARDCEPIAFELLYRSATQDAGPRRVSDMAATADVISHVLQLGLRHVVGDRIAFLNADADFLMSDFVRLVPRDKVVLEILESVDPTAQIIERISDLKRHGFRFALDDVTGPSDLVAKCAGLVDVIKIDVRGTGRDQLVQLARALHHPRRTLLAEKVETAEEFRFCANLSFEYFQGFYFAPPTVVSGSKLRPPGHVLRSLLNLLRADAPPEMVAVAVKNDCSLSRNLVQLARSVLGDAPTSHIESVSQALRIVGRSKLRHWIEILLTSAPASYDKFNGFPKPGTCYQA